MTAAVVAKLSITGDEPLDRILDGLGREGGSVARRSLAHGLSAATKQMRRDAPRQRKRRGRGAKGRFETKAINRREGTDLHKAIGKRQKKIRKSKFYEVKAGVNVGKAGDKRAPHGPIVGLGTGPRNTGTQKRTRTLKGGEKRTTVYRSGSKRKPAYRGYMPKNDFVPDAYAKSGAEVLRRVREKAWKIVEKKGLGQREPASAEEAPE